jgi:hypothetical protein
MAMVLVVWWLGDMLRYDSILHDWPKHADKSRYENMYMCVNCK